MSIQKKSQNSLRRDRNSELLRRMRNGDSLTSYDSAASWFPPRPIIEKDEKALKQLYGRRKTDKMVVADQNQNQGEESQDRTLFVLPKAN